MKSGSSKSPSTSPRSSSRQTSTTTRKIAYRARHAPAMKPLSALRAHPKIGHRKQQQTAERFVKLRRMHRQHLLSGHDLVRFVLRSPRELPMGKRTPKSEFVIFCQQQPFR